MIKMLFEDNRYLFSFNGATKEDEEYIFREFLKTDDLHGNMYLNLIYDIEDYKKYR